jgi:peptide/nickel transport system ATP-binding protein
MRGGGEHATNRLSLSAPERGPGGEVGPTILTVQDLQVHYQTPRGPVKAVNGVSFALRPGERLGLIGKSVSGKTTMGTALMRLTRPPGKIVGGRGSGMQA